MIQILALLFMLAAGAAGAADVEFNTGGEMFMPPEYSGSYTGWAELVRHFYVNETGVDLRIRSVGFPTNFFAADPVPLPVDYQLAVVGAWAAAGEFYPAGAADTNPPDTYTVIDLSAQTLVLQSGATLRWQYRNAGLCGLSAFSGEVTWGYFMGGWVSDADYDRTALMQFTADFLTTGVEDSSFGAVKALY